MGSVGGQGDGHTGDGAWFHTSKIDQVKRQRNWILLLWPRLAASENVNDKVVSARPFSIIILTVIIILFAYK